jgi:Starch-binding associating with outer membrane
MYQYFKRNNILHLIILSLITLSSCKKLSDFGDLNTRKDASAVPLTSGLITSAENSIAGIMSGLGSGLRASMYAQSFSEEQYTEQSLFANPQLDFGATYSGPLMDLQTVINLNTDPATKSAVTVVSSGSNGNQIGIAKILKSYILWTITDRWGDVPYTKALLGSANLSPSYDKQEDIYKLLLADLKAAINSFDGGALVKGDYLYASTTGPIQAAKWKKLANTLRMLISLRMSKVFPAAGGFAATEFVSAATDPAGSILTNADNFVANFDGLSAAGSNVWFNNLTGRSDYDLSLTTYDILNNMSDARLPKFSNGGSAMPYGLTRDKAVAFTASVSGNVARPFLVKTNNTPIVIVPASYTLLAQAEAVQRGWWTPASTAKELYDRGVQASFDQWGVGSATTYLSGLANFNIGSGGGTNIGFNAAYPSIVGADAQTPTPLTRIQLQRYIASYGDGIQAWSEWRRTGIPNLKPTSFATNTPKEIPRRFTYGVTEYSTNTANAIAGAAAISGGDVMNSRVWWDKP